MRLVTKLDKIRRVAEQYEYTYWMDMQMHPDFTLSDGRTPQQVLDTLRALPDDATEDDVTAIMGNTSWTKMVCDTCKEDTDTLVIVSDYSHSASICPFCLDTAQRMINEYEKRVMST